MDDPTTPLTDERKATMRKVYAQCHCEGCRDIIALLDELAAAKGAVANEREECAREAEVLAVAMRNAGAPYMAEGCERSAIAIRARNRMVPPAQGGADGEGEDEDDDRHL